MFCACWAFGSIYAQHTAHLIFNSAVFESKAEQTWNLIPTEADEMRGTVLGFVPKSETQLFNQNKRDSSISVSLWLKPQNINIHSGTIFGEDSVYFFRYLSNQKIQFNPYLKRNINTDGLLTNNAW